MIKNRTIKFRARRIDHKRWVYGHYFMSPLTDENSGADSKDGWFFLCGPKRHCIEENGVSYVIDIDTLEQFTGLKDKNGREVYEGDIIKDTKFETTGSIIWRDKILGYDIEIINPGRELGYLTICWDIIKEDFEIIGNIFENPELMK